MNDELYDCPVCGGHGKYYILSNREGFYTNWVTIASEKPMAFKCDSCNGTGKINWLTIVFFETSCNDKYEGARVVKLNEYQQNLQTISK